jgi:prephenate dehydrogenase
MKIGIVGLGLIGGSMAKSAKARTAHSVFGIDIDEETMMLARICGAVDGPLTGDATGECDLVFLALRPQAAVEWMRENARHMRKNAVVIDLCGVKRAVCAQLAPIAEACGFTYIGGHPMAGKERGGFVNATDDLFVGASMILTPDAKTDIRTLEELQHFFLDVGFSTLTFSTPDEHDRVIAYTSQLAHIASSAYVRSPEALRRRGFSAGSFRDMTRVARLDEDMWSELLLSNSDYLIGQLGLFIDNLQSFKTALEAGDGGALHALLREGREIKAKIGEN